MEAESAGVRLMRLESVDIVQSKRRVEVESAGVRLVRLKSVDVVQSKRRVEVESKASSIIKGSLRLRNCICVFISLPSSSS